MRPVIRNLAAVACVGALLTACSSGTPDATTSQDASANPDEKITLTVATFNEFGYEELIKEYMAENPNITVEQRKAATANEARDNMNTRLAAGSGLADIEAIEIDWLTELMQYPDKFVDLADPELEGRWLDWKTAAVTTEDGKLIGYGTDIGPQGICYRADLMEKAGFPTDREEVAALLEGDWDNYFSVGKDYVAKSGGVAWFDSASATFQGMVNQVENPFENSDGTPIPLSENAEIKGIYDQIATAAVDDGLSAGLAQWTEDWTNAFQGEKFATMVCPSWMLGVIEGNAEGVEGWDIANVYPGGGGNWGGSYLTVPEQGANHEAAKELAAWLTAPEQQIKAFKSKGTFPSQVAALSSPDLLGVKNAFFNNAPTGEILANRAKAVTVVPFKGPKYSGINDAIQQAISRVDIDKTDTPAASWDKFVTAVKALG